MRMRDTATLERFDASTADADAVHAIIERDGAVIIEGLLHADVVARVNSEVGAVSYTHLTLPTILRV